MNNLNAKKNILIIITSVFLLAFLPIITAETITKFNSGNESISLIFDDSTETQNFYIEVPNSKILTARTTINGLDYSGNYVLPADVMLVTDTSGSMNNAVSSTDSNTKIAAAKAADLQFLDGVDMTVVHVGLVEYNTCPTLLQVEELTSDKQKLEETINLYRASGSTNMGLGMMRAIDELTSVRSQNTERKYMLLMTDGKANQHADDNYVCSSGNGYDYSREAAKRAAEEGIIIYTIGFGDDAATSLLEEIAQTTGGTYYFAPSSDELEQIYNQIAEEINEQEFPTPTINTRVPKSILDAWKYPGEYSFTSVWDQNGCGVAGVECQTFDSVLQQNLDECSTDPCTILFNVNSPTKGTLELSNLSIETGNSKGTLRKIPIQACSGIGSLYVYEGSQYQEPDTSFVPDGDELLVFTKFDEVSNVKINGQTPETIYQESDPFKVKVYRTDVTPGSEVDVDITAYKARDARGVQGYFVQDPSHPVYNVTDLGLIYDDGVDEIYLVPGTYDYVFYDKYEKNNDGSDDSRSLSVEIKNPSNQVISQKTYTKPNPSGTQGTVVHEFSVTEEGYYQVSVTTQDSMWWFLFGCEPKVEDFCKDADAIIPVDLYVEGQGCTANAQTTDSEIITAPKTSYYNMTGTVRRGDFKDYPYNCENNEAFYTEVNGKQGPVVSDDAESCKISYKEEFMGAFNIQESGETVTIHTNSVCPPDNSKNGVHIDNICLYDSGDIVCKDKQEYLVYDDYEKTIDLNNIFEIYGNLGTPNNLIEDSGTENLNITPNMPEFEMDVLSNTQTIFHTTGYFTIETDSGFQSNSCPADFTNDDSNYGKITCAAITPAFKLYEGESLDIPVSDIFVITGPNPGTPNKLVQNDNSGVLLTSDLPTNIIATPNGINGLETAYVRILTDNQVVSNLCPIKFTTGDDFGKLDCVSPAPHPRLLDPSEALNMSFYDIFTFEGDYGDLEVFDEVSGTAKLDITPFLDEYYMSVLPIGEVTTTAFLSLTTSKNIRPDTPCPVSFSTNKDNFDDISCKTNPPKYVVQEGHKTTVDLNDVYNFGDDIGTLNELTKVSGTDALVLYPRLEDEEMDVEKVDEISGIKKLDLKIKTTQGIKKTCPAYFEDLGANCDTDECGACFNPSENIYDCLELNSCFDGRISVLNPSVKVRLTNIKHALINQIFDVKEYDVFSKEGPNFVITSDTSPANQNSIFDISGTNVENGNKGAGLFKLEIPYFEAGNRVRICPKLIRVNYNIGLDPELIDSDLIVTSSTVISGYFEEGGFVYSKGPFIFTAKAWLR